MDLENFMKLLGKYQIKARERQPEYYNSKLSDTEFGVKVLYEMFMDMNERLELLESVLEPAPAEKADPEADALRKTKFF